MIITLKTYNHACLTINHVSSKLFSLKNTSNLRTIFKGKKNYIYFSIFANKTHNYIFRIYRTFYFYLQNNKIKEMSSNLMNINPIELSSYKVLCNNVLNLNFLYFNSTNKSGYYKWEFREKYPDIIYIEIKLKSSLNNIFFFTKIDTYI